MVSREALSSQKGETQILPGFQLLGPICLPLVVVARWRVGAGSVKPKHVLPEKGQDSCGQSHPVLFKNTHPGPGTHCKIRFPISTFAANEEDETFSFLTWAAPPACLVTLPSSIPHSQTLPLSVIHKPCAAPTFLCLQVSGASAAGEKSAA